jgi:hypothetical protein
VKAELFDSTFINMSWLLFVLGALATFRLAHLVSRERGPFAIFGRLRKAIPGEPAQPRNGSAASFVFHLRQAPSFAAFFGQPV